MRIRVFSMAAALVVALASSQVVKAQPFVNTNPNAGSPYTRPTVTPYLNLVPGPATNYYLGKLQTDDIRYQMARPPLVLVGPDFLGYDASRSPYQSVTGYQTAEDWVNQRIRETQLSPTGHPAGFLLATPYYRMPNQRTFVPYNQGTSQPQLR
jgi:hypothetical protein